MLTKAEILAASPGLISYRIVLTEEDDDEFELLYDCYADNDEHAVEQAKDAYPGCKIVTVTPNSGNNH